ncbi:MAG: cysteine synthase A [Coriobacteriales bacterium]|nr:cysteine synthase A [Coriobacteriales bacterium]
MVRLSPTAPDQAEVWAKVEYTNPGGSVKDRIALAMIDDAERRGALTAGGKVVEATSGNTGIGLAIVCAARGYQLALVMPEGMSAERIATVEALGATTVATPAEGGMAGSVQVAQAIAASSAAFMPRQFENAANPDAHERTTGPEILEAIPEFDAFVVGVGTGGTLTGAGRAIRRVLPRVRIVAVEPASSPVLSGGMPGAHRIQGIGAGFVPSILDRTLIDEIVPVDDIVAYEAARSLARTDGLFVGVSSGAAAWAAFDVAARLGPGKRVVTLLPDTGERYISLAPYFRI